MLEEIVGLFILGIVTFLSPCSIALISVYLTYVVGASKSIRRGFIIGCSFAVAMCLVFFFLGYAVASLIPLNLINYRLFFGISGVLLILFGINNLGWLKKAGLGHALPVIVLSVLLATARKIASDKTATAGEWLTNIFGLVFLAIGIVMIAYAVGGW